MRGWIACGVLALAACQGQDKPTQRSAGSAAATVVTVADAHSPDASAPKLAITCGPAMLAPRIPAPKKRAAAVDPFAGVLGTAGMGDGSFATDPAAALQGASGVGFRGQGQGGGDVGIGIGIGEGRSGVAIASYSAPVFEIGGLVAKGPLETDVVKRMLLRGRARFIHCLDQEVVKTGKNPALARIQMVIDDQGKVKNVNVAGDANVCIQTAILNTVNFPATADGVTVVTAVFTYNGGTQSQIARGGSQAGGHLRAAPQPPPKPVTKPPPIPDTRSWTPYAASVGLASDDVAQAAGDELVKLMPLAKLETCFAGKDASERTMVTIAFDGGVIGARSGGSGDAQVDACISASLIGLKVGAPPTVSEIACDIVRGDPQPWRVAPESYTVLEISDKEIKEAGVVLTRQTLVPAKADATHSFLIVIDPAAPPALLAAAFERTAWSAATLVAIKSDAGAPVFVAMGRDGRTREPDYMPLIAITHEKDSVKSCLANEARGTAPKAEVQTLFQTLVNSCGAKPCPSTVSIALGGTMQDLAADADAARRAGLPRIGLSTTGCP